MNGYLIYQSRFDCKYFLIKEGIFLQRKYAMKRIEELKEEKPLCVFYIEKVEIKGIFADEPVKTRMQIKKDLTDMIENFCKEL